MSKKFNKWLDLFIEEKEINLDDTFEINKNGNLNIISYGSIIEHMKITTDQEKKKLMQNIIIIDFKNGDLLHFFRHLGQAIARSQPF